MATKNYGVLNQNIIIDKSALDSTIKKTDTRRVVLYAPEIHRPREESFRNNKCIEIF